MAKTRRLKRSATRQNSGQAAQGNSAAQRSSAGWIPAFGLFLAILAVYWPALRGDLLWDDASHVTRPDLQSLHGLWRIWFDLGATQQYYPLLHTAFWLEHRIWGDTVLGYHLINIVLHAASALLVVRIMRRLSLAGAWLGGFAFALHPVCVEAVAWISEQKSTLSATLCLAAVLVYFQFRDTRRLRDYLLATGLFAMAVMCKTVTATLPASLLVIIWWKHGTLDTRRDLAPLLPWFAIGVPAGLFTAWVERTLIGANGAAFALTPLQRFLLASRAVWFYATKLVWPSNLTFSYPHWSIDPRAWWQWLFPVATVVVTVSLCFAARKNRGPLAGFLIYTGTLFPALGFLNVFPFRYSYVADHFQYLASLGVIVPVAAASTWLIQRVAVRSLPRAVLPGVMLVSLAGLTLNQTAMYADDETLYTETLRRNPASWLAHNNLGLILARKPGRLSDAIDEYETALRIEPGYPEAHFNLGSALVHSGIPEKLPAAISEYRVALLLKPAYREAHYNLGNALSQIPGRLPEAIAEYDAVLKLEPELAEAHSNLGNALAQIPGRLSDAITEYRAALRIKPELARTHYNLANALAQIPGKLPEAIAECETALRISPDFEPASRLLEHLTEPPK
jgi:tetratricopeptide (TPR) repeat protein